MNVQELRQLIKTADREHLEKAFVESYKQLRKGQKEEIDPVLTDILEGKETGKKSRNAVSFQELDKQIMAFMVNAYAQNYFAPNRIIPKSQRPKWRFMVKDFIKELEKISPEDENYARAVKLLSDLYHLICEACNYYLFSTEDAFRSIGWAQPQLFELLVKKTFAAGYTRENISLLLVYAATGGLSRESLHIEQEIVLLGGLKTNDVKYIAIGEAERLVEERMAKLAGMGKYDHQRYDLEDEINELCSMILLLTIKLAEPEKGVKYYFKYARESDKEITLYRVLSIIDLMREDKLWLEVYEDGIKKKIKPRDSLRASYEERKSENQEDYIH